jgi:cation transport ATPase
MSKDEWEILLEYHNKVPQDAAEFEGLIRALYETNPDESMITMLLSTLDWFKANRVDCVPFVNRVVSKIKREQEQAQKQKQEQDRLEWRDFIVSLCFSIPALAGMLWLFRKGMLIDKDWGEILGNIIVFIPVALVVISLIYRFVHWVAEQDRLAKSLREMSKSYPWKCLNCGAVVMGTIHGPHGGSSCPNCGGVMVLAGFL